MKSIKLFKHPQIPALTTLSLLKTALEARPPEGFTTAEMRSRLKILDQIDAVDETAGSIDLSEAEHAMVVAAVTQVRWAVLDKFIVDFEDSLKL